MRVALLYPPPWKTPDVGQAPDPRDGPPEDFREGDLDSDFFQIPYGLLSLAAQALRAGHRVKVFNLSALPWSQVLDVVSRLESEVVGLSCWTANRRGVALVADAIKSVRPSTHVTIGGPHATALPGAMLHHHASIDTVIEAEGEATFLELLERIEAGRDLSDLPGAWTRDADGERRGPARPAIRDLDALVSPHRLFATHIVMTSRGCPWACTFCGAEASWGRGFRGRSVPQVLDDLEQALRQVPTRMLLIKDDTFTANRRRALDICRGIRQRRLNFLWSCDTRVDVLGDELLREMRLAGCERLSLGVESGSPKVLSAINKKITVEQIRESTELARRYGIRTRYYMMLGNRGETRQTFGETLEFLEAARPHQYIFSCLSIYPGTTDFDDAVKAGWLTPEVYFEGKFQELKAPFDASPELTRTMNQWFEDHRGVRVVYRPSIEDATSVLSALGTEHHAAHVDLASTLLDAGRLDQAELHLGRGLDLGYPAPGIIYNSLAVIAWRRGDFEGMKQQLVNAARVDPQHHVLLNNAKAARDWFSAGCKGSLRLEHDHDFLLYERTSQPMLPGPLPERWQDWDLYNAVTPCWPEGAGETSQVVVEPRRLQILGS